MLKWITRLFPVFAFPAILWGQICEVASVKEVSHPWKAATWLLVDLDNCLFESRQALGHANWFYDLVQERIEEGMTKVEAIMDAYPLWIAVQERCGVQPIEADFIRWIDGLQESGITVIGCTHRHPTVAHATVPQVRSLGVDFTKSAPAIATPFHVDIEGPACYKEGILFVGDYNSKSAVLSSFLKEIEATPEEIVFIDDKRKNVEEFEPALKEMGIAYLGLHYTAIQNKPAIYERSLADLQFRVFNSILSNEEAAHLLTLHRLSGE